MLNTSTGTYFHLKSSSAIFTSQDKQISVALNFPKEIYVTANANYWEVSLEERAHSFVNA